MAEQEIAKHSKKMYKTWTSKEHGLWYKIKEFLLEIIIITFAISISIWFHNRSEHRHQQADAKVFLVGLKKDLLVDIAEMKADMQSYQMQKSAFDYVVRTKLGVPLDKDSMNHYSRWYFNTTALIANNGRFEGFKSSGKISVIENDTLQNDILDLYQEDIPSLLAATQAYTNRKNRLLDYVQKNLRRLSDSTNNFAEIMNTEEAHTVSMGLSYIDEIVTRYERAIDKMQKIINEIDREYDNP